MRVKYLRRKLRCCMTPFKLLALALIVRVVRCVSAGEKSQHPTKQASTCTLDDASNESALSVQWVDERTKRFTKRWSNHKSRNIVIYGCLATRRLPIVKNVAQYFLLCPKVFYSELYERLFEIPAVCMTHACFGRLGKSHYVYAEFVYKTFDTIVASKLRPQIPSSEGKIAVLVEPREHPLLEFTVKQVMHTLGEDWALQIFVSSKNINFVRRKLNVYDSGSGRHIVLTNLSRFGLDELGAHGNRAQSAFSAHRRLYEAILSEHILWFQIDVIMRGVPLASWLRFAYIGAEWRGCEYPTCSQLACSAVCGGGNSGLSLRRRSKLLTVATEGNLPQDLWGHHVIDSTETTKTKQSPGIYSSEAVFVSDEFHDNSARQWFEDDLQLSYKLSKLGQLPPSHLPPRFAFSQALPKEGFCVTEPIGLHKPWSAPWIQPQVIMNLLARPFECIKGDLYNCRLMASST